jgi:hypothetical protein
MVFNGFLSFPSVVLKIVRNCFLEVVSVALEEAEVLESVCKTELVHLEQVVSVLRLRFRHILHVGHLKND